MLPAVARLVLRSLLHALWVGALLGLAVIIAASIGETHLGLSVVLEVLGNKLWNAGHLLDPIDAGIIWNYRLPRALVAGACGAGLATAGAVLQALLRNPLADPYLLGISAGASTGAVLVTLLGVGAGMLSMSGGAFIGALGAFALVTLLARSARGGGSNGQIILAGIAGSQLFNALTSFLITASASAEQARGLMFWLLGNLSGIRWPAVWLALPVVLLGLLVCLWHRRALDAFTFGSDSAAALGIAVRRVRMLLVACTALMTAVLVSIVGSIGFVGLVIPHAVRLLTGPRHTRLLPLSALCGALFLMAADVLSRTLLKGQVLPIGVITALVGAPVFALILVRGQRPR